MTDDLAIHQWLVVPHAVEFELPQGNYTVTAISGLETEQSRRELNIEGLAELKIVIPLTRFANPAGEGFRSGNLNAGLGPVG